MGTQEKHGSPAAAMGLRALLILVAAIALAACGGSSTTASTSPSAAPSQAMSPSASPSETPLPTPTVAGMIAFEQVVEVVDYGNGPFVESGDIYVVKTDGSGLKRLTNDAVSETHPSWSPDGRRIVYMVSRIVDGTPVNPHLWVMNADGSGKRQLTKGSAWATDPAWSADGKQIFFTGWGYGVGSVLSSGAFYVMSAEGGAPKKVLRQGARATEGLPAWAPDGRILFVSLGDVWIVKPDGSGRTQLTQIGNVTDFALSPNGKSLAIDNNSAGTVEILPVRGGAGVTLLDPISDFVPGPFVNLAWTPDGKALVVADAGSSGSRLYVINADGTGLSAVPGVETACAPAWRP